MKKRNLSRRQFLALPGWCGLAGAERGASRNKAAGLGGDEPQLGRAVQIDLPALVARHNPLIRSIDPQSPLSLGNGEFAFTADITGLQTFPGAYQNHVPLCTMSHWGWHSTPLHGLDPNSLRLEEYDAHGRRVGYATSSAGQTEIYNWLRENPHRLHLGQIGLRLMLDNGREVQLSDISSVEQKLDLWSGLLTSRFTVAGKPVTVRTAVHPAVDLLAFVVETPLIAEGRVAARFTFPYGDPGMQAANWEKPQ